MSETENLTPQEPGAGSETENLTVQEPGAPPAPELQKLVGILGKGAKAIPALLVDLDDEELSTLRTIEAASEKPRPLVLKAIDVEVERRVADAGLGSAAARPEPEVNPEHPYAHLPAGAIDRTRIKNAVLSRDGWVLPLPRAEG